MTDLSPVRRALISVSDKSGLAEFGQALAQRGVELLSTGGTARALRDAGCDVKDVSEVTGFPEMMDGRVKTLHPVVHGGLLALRDDPGHVASMESHHIAPIDLVVVNLYPFEEALKRGAPYAEMIENIDIGGPAMIRSAAKNHGFVTIVVDVQDYAEVLAELDGNDGQTSYSLRQRLAARAYQRTAAYDSAVSTWMAEQVEGTPRRRAFAGELVQELRYGENPHQSASFYADGSARPGVATARQHQGKELSYNNINDTDAAFELVSEFAPADGPACVIIKHANPCGAAWGATLKEAYQKAFDCDRTSAFGGIVALNQPLDAETAKEIVGIFTEVVIAPGVSDDAAKIFAAKKNLRLLSTEGLADPRTKAIAAKQVAGGWLVQDKDTGFVPDAELRVVTKVQPSAEQMADLRFAWTIAKHVKSNAIVYVKDGATVGVGAGQMSRVDSAMIAAKKAERMAEAIGLPQSLAIGSAVASDAFFPFPDGLMEAAAAGATCVIQPGGSMRDDEVIAAADEAGLAMVFTGMRHFRH